jgi:hypothetical protein
MLQLFLDSAATGHMQFISGGATVDKHRYKQLSSFAVSVLSSGAGRTGCCYTTPTGAVSHALFLCFAYSSHNKQRSFPWTILSGWSLCFLRGTVSVSIYSYVHEGLSTAGPNGREHCASRVNWEKQLTVDKAERSVAIPVRVVSVTVSECYS